MPRLFSAPSGRRWARGCAGYRTARPGRGWTGSCGCRRPSTSRRSKATRSSVMTIRPRGVRSVEIETGDPERVARFYAEVWNLVPVASEQGAIHFRATGDLHHVLTLRPGAGPPAIRRVVLDVADRDQLAWLHGRIAAAGGEIEAPHAL